ncbi:chorismate mutase [Bifidobacterium dolichotidis]|uniref:prephenate dehydratase n=1 Tax=Bifidobacterium dolichotidis TaxID=2306976 RepID=A0A430FS67_9BIFI|nr:prephenate dehydratase domain-containing protein [Bifidobacterium dolichotidis]RSX55732.1 chorismate mutase [Bifidobacterium dolichotidis]
MTTLFYLGPEGTFTQQAALTAVEQLHTALPEIELELQACEYVSQIAQHVEHGDGWGIIAWENNVEGYVVPNLDMLIDAHDMAGFLRVGIDITFDAYVTEATWQAAQDRQCSVFDLCKTVTAHSHGLAQCMQFIQQHQLKRVPASSNAAGCRDLQFGAIALGPSLCGELYHLHRIGTAVQDFRHGRTEFLVTAHRQQVRQLLEQLRHDSSRSFESIVTFIPLVTGPGVLANLLDCLRDAGLNMTSFISRPIKGHQGTYSFIATLDSAPWELNFRETLHEVLQHGDWVRTLAVYPHMERPTPPVTEWMLPQGGLCSDTEDEQVSSHELLW